MPETFWRSVSKSFSEKKISSGKKVVSVYEDISCFTEGKITESQVLKSKGMSGKRDVC